MFGLFFISCNSPVAEESIDSIDTLPLERTRLLRRISLDLRGTLPTMEDHARFNDIGEDAIIDQFLTDDNHAELLLDIFNGWMKTRIDQFNLSYVDYHLDPQLEYTFVRDISEEPLRLMAHVAQNDLPWTDWPQNNR